MLRFFGGLHPDCYDKINVCKEVINLDPTNKIKTQPAGLGGVGQVPQATASASMGMSDSTVGSVVNDDLNPIPTVSSVPEPVVVSQTTSVAEPSVSTVSRPMGAVPQAATAVGVGTSAFSAAKPQDVGLGDVVSDTTLQTEDVSIVQPEPVTSAETTISTEPQDDNDPTGEIGGGIGGTKTSI